MIRTETELVEVTRAIYATNVFNAEELVAQIENCRPVRDGLAMREIIDVRGMFENSTMQSQIQYRRQGDGNVAKVGMFQDAPADLQAAFAKAGCTVPVVVPPDLVVRRMMINVKREIIG